MKFKDYCYYILFMNETNYDYNKLISEINNPQLISKVLLSEFEIKDIVSFLDSYLELNKDNIKEILLEIKKYNNSEEIKKLLEENSNIKDNLQFLYNLENIISSKLPNLLIKKFKKMLVPFEIYIIVLNKEANCFSLFKLLDILDNYIIKYYFDKEDEYLIKSIRELKNIAAFIQVSTSISYTS